MERAQGFRNYKAFGKLIPELLNNAQALAQAVSDGQAACSLTRAEHETSCFISAHHLLSHTAEFFTSEVPDACCKDYCDVAND